MKKFVVFRALCLSAVLGGNLLAVESNVEKQLDMSKEHKAVKGEKNAWYVGMSYQVGQASESVKNPPKSSHFNYPKFPVGKTDYLAVMQGLGLTIGYKQFFGDKRWFGMRYYVFMDYGHAIFGANALTSDSGGACELNKPCATKVGTMGNVSDMFTYGGGIDTLYNVISKEDVSFGFFLGAQIAGNSWGNTTGGFLETKSPYRHSSASLTPSIFQFLFNVGIRTHIGKHQGFDFGVKIPTINVNYFNRGGLSFTYRRQYALYVGYRYSF
ncbi:outer membrane protein [Helicobacter cetorum]|uniref:Outer membrane protein HorF n=1 Tax=Helicobacter cetorum (strain ATCC BAA-540 / CCUG 52418 / MIT 99-5656) TaxID=1163745 RepID=I0ESY3_HELCM|nr:outer membrane protein [Helicobacter cetorum]AFI06052.1 outer membrane protein HorF [Helicobacter cetorum MIT 99-5656]